MQTAGLYAGAALAYFKHGRVKMEVGLCKGKKLYDKRADAAQRDAKRSIDRAVKSNGKYY